MGERTDTVIVRESMDTLTVVGDTVIQGETWYRTELINRLPGGEFGESLFTNREDGLWRWLSTGENRSPVLVFRYPSEVGATYEVRQWLTATLVEEDVAYETASGSVIESYQYEHVYERILHEPELELAEPVRHTSYLSPVVGPVRLECSWVSTNADEEGRLHVIGWSTWELREFIPAQR